MLQKAMDLQGKHIFTKTFGDGEINTITKKSYDEADGIFVYFHSNRDGEIKLDGEEFLNDIERVQDIKA